MSVLSRAARDPLGFLRRACGRLRRRHLPWLLARLVAAVLPGESGASQAKPVRWPFSLMAARLEGALAAWSEGLPVPLYVGAEAGEVVRAFMTSPAGARIRAVAPRLQPVCRLFPENLVVLSNGVVTTCCLDSCGVNGFASLNEARVDEIWDRIVPEVMGKGLYELERCRACIGRPPGPSFTAEPVEQDQWRAWRDRKPRFLQIEPVANCNYRCTGCFAVVAREHRKPLCDLERAFEGIVPILPRLQRLTVGYFGEPLLHPGLSRFLSRCRAASSDLAVELLTNGRLLTGQVARDLIAADVSSVVVGVHGAPGTENMLRYSQVGADYAAVLGNVRRLLELRRSSGRSRPLVALKAVLFSWNDSDELMDRFRADALSLGLVPGGDSGCDNYHWVLDVRAGPDASRRFVPGSAALEGLVRRRELPPWGC